MASRPTRYESPEAAVAAYRRKGDPDAIRALFDLTAPALFRAALASMSDASGADDVLQDTYIAFLDRIDDFSPGRPVMPWLMGILKNRTKQQRRANARMPDPTRVAVRIDEQASHDDDQSAVRAAIERLDEPYRSVGLLHFVYGLQPAEIAHVRDEPPGTIRSQLHRARERLSNSLRASPALMLLGSPVRSLAKIREQVVGHAISGAAITTGLVGIGGLLVSKKFIGFVLIALVLTAGALFWRPGKSDDSRASGPSRASLLEGEGQRPAAALKAPPPKRVARAKAPAHPHISGRVVDSQGTPVPGARISTVPVQHRKRSVGPSSENAFHAESDGEGHFFVRVGDTTPLAAVFVEAEGYAPQTAELTRAGDTLLVVVAPGMRLHGRIRNEKGDPVSGAKVECLALISGVRWETQVVADVSGRYAFVGVPSHGDATKIAKYLRVTATGYVQHFALHQLASEPQREQEHDIEMVAGSSVSGRVVYAATGKPVPHATVVAHSGLRSMSIMKLDALETLSPYAQRVVDTAIADAVGRFQLDHMPPPPSAQNGRRAWAVSAWGADTCAALAEVERLPGDAGVALVVRVHPGRMGAFPKRNQLLRASVRSLN